MKPYRLTKLRYEPNQAHSIFFGLQMGTYPLARNTAPIIESGHLRRMINEENACLCLVELEALDEDRVAA